LRRIEARLERLEQTFEPVTQASGKVILAEFGYDRVIMETFPFDRAKEGG
jgi:hypothetical protein